MGSRAPFERVVSSETQSPFEGYLLPSSPPFCGCSAGQLLSIRSAFVATAQGEGKVPPRTVRRHVVPSRQLAAALVASSQVSLRFRSELQMRREMTSG
jgi:hypothetical protein